MFPATLGQLSQSLTGVHVVLVGCGLFGARFPVSLAPIGVQFAVELLLPLPRPHRLGVRPLRRGVFLDIDPTEY